MSFNKNEQSAAVDPELEKIVGDIQDLQQGIARHSQGEVSPPQDEAAEMTTASEDSEDPMQDFRSTGGDAPMEETLRDIKEETPVGQSSPLNLDDEVDEEGSEPMAYEGDSSEGTLTVALTGNMKLKLRYEFEGHEITVGFSDGSLCVQVSDGSEFKIPIRREGSREGKRRSFKAA